MAVPSIIIPFAKIKLSNTCSYSNDRSKSKSINYTQNLNRIRFFRLGDYLTQMVLSHYCQRMMRSCILGKRTGLGGYAEGLKNLLI